MSLIFVVIRDTYNNKSLENDTNQSVKGESELDDSSSSSTNTTTNKRINKRSNQSRRELNKLKEYALAHGISFVPL